MVITREDLKNMYIEHVEIEKIRIAKLIEEDYKSFVQEILEENRLGRNCCQRKSYECSEIYINVLLNKIQELFVDSKITTRFVTNDGSEKYILINIDWSLC